MRGEQEAFVPVAEPDPLSRRNDRLALGIIAET